jgi:MoaA/NifB/PqqE/SkfB family radical SAM enzyme
MQPLQPFAAAHVAEKTLSYLQIESSFACQLACLNCYPGVDRKTVLERTPGGHLSLKLDAYEKMVGDLARGGVDVKVIEFQGHGEPLVNKNIWRMIRFARERFPASEVKVVTHAGFDFQPDMRDSGVSEIIFSIDGVDQESYEKYRVHGDYARAFKFMKDFSTVRLT